MPAMSFLTLLAGVLVALVLGWAAVAKLVRFSQWREALGAYGLPPGVASVAAVAVPLAELSVVGLMLVGRALAGAALTLGLLSVFSLTFPRVRLESGNRVPCGCFGKATNVDIRLLIARNGALAALAGIILIAGRDHLVTGSISGWATVLPSVLVVIGLSLALWLVREITEASRRQ
jgi:Methylamine utilisation protein MauE